MSAPGEKPYQIRSGDETTADAFGLTPPEPKPPKRTRAQIQAEAAAKRAQEEAAKAERQAKRQAARAEKKAKPRAQEYAEAYAAGQTDASGTPFSVPTALAVFWPILKAHAGGRDGAELLKWIRESSAEYRKAMKDEARFQHGFSPKMWGQWLDNGKPRGLRSGSGRFMQKVDDFTREDAKRRQAAIRTVDDL